MQILAIYKYNISETCSLFLVNLKKNLESEFINCTKFTEITKIFYVRVIVTCNNANMSIY